MATTYAKGKEFLNDFEKGKACIRPLSDHVLVEREVPEEKSKGGIFIPQAAQEKPQRGAVIATGPGTLDKEGKRVAMQVKPGDVILFTKWGGTEAKELGDDRVMLRESDIIGVIE